MYYPSSAELSNDVQDAIAAARRLRRKSDQ